jgi:hypothetical protein
MSGPIIPTDALRALAAVLAPYLVPLIAGASSRPFSQRELPSGSGRVKYLRTWRRAHDAGDAGAWSEGRARLMTADCWAKWSRTTDPCVAATLPVAPTLLDELGAKRVHT